MWKSKYMSNTKTYIYVYQFLWNIDFLLIKWFYFALQETQILTTEQVIPSYESLQTAIIIVTIIDFAIDTIIGFIRCCLSLMF